VGCLQIISNIRGISCIAFEGVFRSQFDAATDKTLITGVMGAFVEGCTYPHLPR
jgi:ATP-binding cassette subfamily B (MDR/TAP) protein 1